MKPYGWRKALVQGFMAWSGCLLSHVLITSEGMQPQNLAFWKHIFFVAFVTSGVSELTYLREWAKQYLGNGDSIT